MNKLYILLCAIVLSGCGNSRATSDSLGINGLSVDPIRARVDPLTGCEYITYREGGITPRMDSSGKQVCRVQGTISKETTK